MDCSTSSSPVFHHLLELAQAHVHWLMMPSNHLILCHLLLLPPSIFPSIRVFSSESVLCIRWPKYWSFSLNISSLLSGIFIFSFSSVAQSCPILWPHQLQYARPPCPLPTPGVYPNSWHWVGDANQPSHPLLSPSPPALNLSQHQGLFKRVSSSLQVAKVLEFQLQHQSLQWILRTNFL